MITFADMQQRWADTPTQHEAILVDTHKLIAANKRMYEHRQWVEANKYGFGHPSFHYVWWQLVKELPDDFKFMELGVFRGQSVSAVKLAAQLQNKLCSVYAVSSFNGSDGTYYEHRDNYIDDVKHLFDLFNNSEYPVFIRGYTQEDTVKETVKAIAPFDAIYVDADHTYPATTHDLTFYAPLVKVGGYLLSDDSAVDLKLPPHHFKGFEGATQACKEYFTGNNAWEYISNIMHLKIWRKLS